MTQDLQYTKGSKDSKVLIIKCYHRSTLRARNFTLVQYSQHTNGTGKGLLGNVQALNYCQHQTLLPLFIEAKLSCHHVPVCNCQHQRVLVIYAHTLAVWRDALPLQVPAAGSKR